MTKIKFRRKLRKLRHKLKLHLLPKNKVKLLQLVKRYLVLPLHQQSMSHALIQGMYKHFWIISLARHNKLHSNADYMHLWWSHKLLLKADGVVVIYRLQLIIFSGSSGQAREHILSYQHRNFIMAPTIRSMINFNVTQAMLNLWMVMQMWSQHVFLNQRELIRLIMQLQRKICVMGYMEHMRQHQTMRINWSGWSKLII